MSYFQHFNISFALIFQSSCSTLNTIRHWVVMFLFTQKEILPICWVAALSGDNSNHGAPHWNTMIVSLHGVFMLPSCCPFNPWLGYRFISFVCRTTFTPLLSIPLHKLQILFILIQGWYWSQRGSLLDEKFLGHIGAIRSLHGGESGQWGHGEPCSG